MSQKQDTIAKPLAVIVVIVVACIFIPRMWLSYINTMHENTVTSALSEAIEKPVGDQIGDRGVAFMYIVAEAADGENKGNSCFVEDGGEVVKISDLDLLNFYGDETALLRYEGVPQEFQSDISGTDTPCQSDSLIITSRHDFDRAADRWMEKHSSR